MTDKSIEIISGKHFGTAYKITENPCSSDFVLHNHDDIYEIVLLLDGDCEFLVEGNAYKLKPGDIFFTRPFELHHISFLSKRTYERFILYIKSEFFKANSCERFLDIFENREIGTGNIISGGISNSVLADCMERLRRYNAAAEYDVCSGAVYEFLYLINSCRSKGVPVYVKNETVRNIIMYINDNLPNELTLDIISKKFFISKPYMCRIFKENTGCTLTEYINRKRILLSQELLKAGASISEACFASGFASYANFYKAHIKFTGSSPKNML